MKGAGSVGFGGKGNRKRFGEKGKFSERRGGHRGGRDGDKRLGKENEASKAFSSSFNYLIVLVNLEVVFCKEVILEFSICLEASRYQLK